MNERSSNDKKRDFERNTGDFSDLSSFLQKRGQRVRRQLSDIIYPEGIVEREICPDVSALLALSRTVTKSYFGVMLWVFSKGLAR